MARKKRKAAKKATKKRKTTKVKAKKNTQKYKMNLVDKVKLEAAIRKAKITKKKVKVKIGKTHIVISPSWDSKRDAKRKAKPPRKRVSKSGKVYYEYRANRSDVADV